jgi:hypothetical protein
LENAILWALKPIIDLEKESIEGSTTGIRGALEAYLKVATRLAIPLFFVLLIFVIISVINIESIKALKPSFIVTKIEFDSQSIVNYIGVFLGTIVALSGSIVAIALAVRSDSLSRDQNRLNKEQVELAKEQNELGKPHYLQALNLVTEARKLNNASQLLKAAHKQLGDAMRDDASTEVLFRVTNAVKVPITEVLLSSEFVNCRSQSPIDYARKGMLQNYDVFVDVVNVLMLLEYFSVHEKMTRANDLFLTNWKILDDSLSRLCNDRLMLEIRSVMDRISGVSVQHTNYSNDATLIKSQRAEQPVSIQPLSEQLGDFLPESIVIQRLVHDLKSSYFIPKNNSSDQNEKRASGIAVFSKPGGSINTVLTVISSLKTYLDGRSALSVIQGDRKPPEIIEPETYYLIVLEDFNDSAENSWIERIKFARAVSKTNETKALILWTQFPTPGCPADFQFKQYLDDGYISFSSGDESVQFKLNRNVLTWFSGVSTQHSGSENNYKINAMNGRVVYRYVEVEGN